MMAEPTPERTPLETPLDELLPHERAIAVHHKLSAVWGAMPYAGGIVSKPRIDVIAEEGHPSSAHVAKGSGWTLELVLEHLERLKGRLEQAAEHDYKQTEELFELRDRVTGAEAILEPIVEGVVDRRIEELTGALERTIAVDIRGASGSANVPNSHADPAHVFDTWSEADESTPSGRRYIGACRCGAGPFVEPSTADLAATIGRHLEANPTSVAHIGEHLDAEAER